MGWRKGNEAGPHGQSCLPELGTHVSRCFPLSQESSVLSEIRGCEVGVLCGWVQSSPPEPGPAPTSAGVPRPPWAEQTLNRPRKLDG